MIGPSYAPYSSYPPQQYSAYPPQQYPQRPAQQVPAGKVKVWGIGLRQIVAMIVGTALFAIVGYAVDSLFVHSTSSSTLFNPIFPTLPGTFFGFLNPANLLAGLTFVVPLFFGVEFGPWVGLVVAVGAGWLADTISNYRTYSGLQWYWYLAIAVLGFVAGLALAITRGRYNRFSSFFIAMLMSAVGTFLYFLIGVYGDSTVYHYVQSSFAPALFGLTLTYVICFIPLLILLLIYNAITRNMKRA
jgi:hypothetical protein